MMWFGVHVLFAAAFTHGQTPSTQPITTPATVPILTELPEGLSDRVAEVNRLRREVRTELNGVRKLAASKLRQLLPNYAVLQSPESRAALSGELSQTIRQMVQVDWALLLSGAQGETRETELYGSIFSAREVSMYNAILLAVVDDQEAVGTLVKFYDWKPESISLAADFLKADLDGQKAIAGKIVARLNSKNEADVAPLDAAFMILRREFTTDPDVSGSMLAAIKSFPLTVVYKTSLTRYEAQTKLKGALGQLNQPIEIKGKLVDGTEFSTASLKGKVIIVDFWATWCGPCKAELPRIKALRAKYKNQGLEVLGISNDVSRPQLEDYLKSNEGMDYPQLFDDKAANDGKFHPIATGFGINAIPALYLIDRQGILRSVDARQNLEAETEKLITEAP